MTAVRPFVVDVDTGVDDALALLYLAQHPSVNLLAVTCVDGNARVDQVVANTRQVLLAAGRADVPIGRGAERPLVEPARHASAFHGTDGLGGLSIPVPAAPRAHALDLLRSALDDSQVPVTILALGPLTNIALLLRAFPHLAGKIERIVFMGGSMGVGNATAVAEFNAWHDPEALDIVLRSGVPITMYGLDVFYAAVVQPDLFDDSSTSSALARALLNHLHMQEAAETRVAAGSCIGDAGTACAAVRPELATTRAFPVAVVLAGTARGQTIVDQRSSDGEDATHDVCASTSIIDVVTAIDADLLAEEFVTAVTDGALSRGNSSLTARSAHPSVPH